MSSACLNCATHLTETYCPKCGQKSTTHRYSIKHFVEHDFVHGVWHVDRGLLFTVKQLFTRPGHSVREYIQGKRVNYFSFITLILLILTITTLIAPYVHVKLSDLAPGNNRQAMTTLEQFISKYPKLVIVLMVPLNSVFSFLWFRKARLNFSEHLVANSYKAASELLIGLAFTFVIILYPNISVLRILYMALISPSILVYGIWFYRQLFSAFGYSKWALLGRSLAVIVSILLFHVVLGVVWSIVQR
ncbi:hypothetical protein C7T94_11245 [Pedobacter yulinensis]|uniref:DUF3667 domain-containing protein n=1 Tax=Pedobacter yulinensis TaxID=2126353 RepID=A0A2T3HL26_9SPHI|nr:DUF3667 domain-containing protein [Pedobacter yulinensis]PST83168.1 hypothetical protein C7T94_11245 [Pedobacter yulinensis]